VGLPANRYLARILREAAVIARPHRHALVVHHLTGLDHGIWSAAARSATQGANLRDNVLLLADRGDHLAVTRAASAAHFARRHMT